MESARDSEIIILDANDDNPAFQWVPAEWIARGKKYENVPAHVEGVICPPLAKSLAATDGHHWLPAAVGGR
jgi:hypothetical protein